MTDSAADQNDTQQLNVRIQNLEERIDELVQRVDNLVGRLGRLDIQQSHQARETRARNAAEPLVSRQELTPGLAAVVRLVALGKGEESEAMLRELTPEELAGNPAVVAIVAAVLCIQRNDFQSALKALNRARQLTNDDRLLKVLNLVEAQMG